MNPISELRKKTPSGFLPSAKDFVMRHKKAFKLGALILVSGAMMFNAFAQVPQILKNKEDIKVLEDAIAYEDERVEEVERLNEIVGTEEYIEKIAREKLGMVKEDEKLFVDVSKK